jgi:uncharacterized membrane protein YhaH (DUF805 family)
MNFIEAVKKCLTNYANFEGRARRSEYWWFFLFNIILSIITTMIDISILQKGVNDVGIVNTILSLALLLPSIAVGVRRMHDLGKSGWFILIPIYNIILFCTNGQDGTNEYGPDPKSDTLVDEIDLIGTT